MAEKMEEMNEDNKIISNGSGENKDAQLTESARDNQQSIGSIDQMNDKQQRGNVDDKFLIREQERLNREKKRQKNRKKKRIALAVCVVIVAAVIYYLGWGRALLAASQNTDIVEISAGAGQEIVYAFLNSVRGNEITYTVTSQEEAEGIGGSPALLQMPEGEEGMPEGIGEVPEGIGEVPKGTEEMPDGRGIVSEGMVDSIVMQPEGMMDGRVALPEDTDEEPASTAASETVTAYIPVGTPVTTRLGTVTTFSRLAAGDYVALVVDKKQDGDTIAAVYIVN